jgi:hypothetical protein
LLILVLVDNQITSLRTFIIFCFRCNGKLGVIGSFKIERFYWLILSSLITYHETYLLVDVHSTTQETKQEVALIVAHELAHQWFGNLVVSHFDSSLRSQIISLDDGMVE